MLVQFRVRNYRSFKDDAILNMAATPLKADDPEVDENNTFQSPDETPLLKAAAIYGANASGKSNLITAMQFMRKFVLGSSKDTQAKEEIPVEPFQLNISTPVEPSCFEMVFFVEGTQYRYGFEATRENIISEWLLHVPKNREVRLFARERQKIIVSKGFKEGNGVEDKTRENALFLSVVAQFNGPVAKKVIEWFSQMIILPAGSETQHSFLTLVLMKDDWGRPKVIDFLRSLEPSIMGIDVMEPQAPEFPPDMPEEMKVNYETLVRLTGQTVETSHQVYNGQGEEAGLETFDLKRHESMGTQKLFFLAGQVLLSLRVGRPIVVDELDARLHPLLTRAIIGMFSSKETNPRNAQLIFATHDTNLLSKDFFRRDQIWFTEKDRFGATSLYSLAEFSVRNDASFGRDYIRGKYGAIPFIGDLTHLLDPAHE